MKNHILKDGIRLWASAIVMLGIASLTSDQRVSAAVIFPYSDNFNTDTAGSNAPNFTSTRNANSSASSWTVGNSALIGSVSDTTFGGGFATDLLSVSGVGTNAFALSTSLQVSTIAAGTFSLGLEAFGNASNLPNNSTGTGYFAVIDKSGNLILGQYTNSSSFTYNNIAATTASIGTLSTTSTYVLTLTGTYVGGALTLDFQVSDGTNTVSIISNSLTTPLTGSYFGYQERLGGTSTNTTLAATYDNFNLSVIPEPSACALLIGGMMLLLAVAKRSRVQA